jgi:hypothetical protein
MIKKIVVCIALIATMAHAEAAQLWEDGPVFQLGYGLQSCAKFTSAQANVPLGQATGVTWADGRTYFAEGSHYVTWAQGFISAANLFDRRLDIRVDNAGIDGWLRRWCEQHPADGFGQAVKAFIVDRADNHGGH